MKNIYMERALSLAKKAFDLGEIPVGAVIVQKSTKNIIGEGYNLREMYHSPICHAEIIAINNASKKLGDWRLSGCDLYVTLEPCMMCAGAIVNARIDRVYFGAFDLTSGAVCSALNLFNVKNNFNPEYYAGIYEKQCTELLNKFFSKIRK